MSSETTNIGLVLPELSEAFDLERHWNHNSVIIDAEIGALKQTTAEHTQDIEGLKQTTTAQGQLIAGKQDRLTFDSMPTSGSSDPVTSGGIYTDQQRQETEIGVVAARGAKNLLEFDGCSAPSTAGVSYTINADGTVTVNGTPQGSSPSYVQLMLKNNAVRVEDFCDGSHILSGCPNGGSDSSYRLYVAKGSYSRFDYGDGVLLTETALTDVRIVIYIANGYTANNLVFKPMIRRAEITDDTYVPYAPTNRELYEMILALQSGVSAQSAASLMQAGRIDAEMTDAQEVTDDA